MIYYLPIHVLPTLDQSLLHLNVIDTLVILDTFFESVNEDLVVVFRILLQRPVGQLRQSAEYC